MKKLLFFLLASIILFSCENENDLFESGESIRKSEVLDQKKTISLGVGGEYTTSLKTRSNSDDLILVVVLKGDPFSDSEENDSDSSFIDDSIEDVDDSNQNYIYAVGLFDDISKANVELDLDDFYSFQVLIIKNGKNVLTNENGIYGAPFNLRCTNTFDYNADYDIFESNGVDYIDGSDYSYAPVDTFFGMYFGFDPMSIENDSSSLNIDLYRMGFGIKLNVDGLTEGKFVMSSPDNSFKEVQVIYPNNSSDIIYYSFYNIIYTYYNLFEDINESILPEECEFKWVKENGEAQVIDNREISFTRNELLTINVEI